MICLKPSSWLASQKVDKNVQLHGRSPYGERGLKFDGVIRVARYNVRAKGHVDSLLRALDKLDGSVF